MASHPPRGVHGKASLLAGPELGALPDPKVSIFQCCELKANAAAAGHSQERPGVWAGLLIHFRMVPGERGHYVLPDTFPGHAPTLSRSGVGGQGASSKKTEPLDNQLHPGLPIAQVPEPFSEPHGPECKLPGGARPTQTWGPGGGSGRSSPAQAVHRPARVGRVLRTSAG